ncbi:hypothetical protein L596_021010 [Steinernema carpocapsae]|uniref:Protein kinase domain-containing protein n=1 Tax=Steinernema carpocapsae TaxID=34508 RepID=A0A4U5MVV4_STECR|nr:hypothetical protein L596_021010 [Steinernema carpocapsae]
MMDKAGMNQKVQQLLEGEVASMEEMHHPNIIRLFERVETLSRTYLIMEYAGGGELDSFVNARGRLPEHEAKQLFSQIVSAVTHMHQKGYIHRDIKPENIVFSRPGKVKLIDFGFAQKCDRTDTLTDFFCSPLFAAPEKELVHYSGHKVDVYALGVLLYFMLVGTVPFDGESIVELKMAIFKGDYRKPDYMSAAASHIISRMLDRNPDTRIHSDEIKQNFWLKEAHYPKQHAQFSLSPNMEDLEKSETVRRAWNKLNDYGISTEMLLDAGQHGVCSPIIGIYRIVLHQEQGSSNKQKHIKTTGHNASVTSEKNQTKRKPKKQLKSRSKTCTLL